MKERRNVATLWPLESWSQWGLKSDWNSKERTLKKFLFSSRKIVQLRHFWGNSRAATTKRIITRIKRLRNWKWTFVLAKHVGRNKSLFRLETEERKDFAFKNDGMFEEVCIIFICGCGAQESTFSERTRHENFLWKINNRKFIFFRNVFSEHQFHLIAFSLRLHIRPHSEVWLPKLFFGNNIF